MSADSHISWILIRLSEHSRAEFDLLGTPGSSPTHRFPTFPHCYSGLGNRAAAARLYWPPIPAGSARRTLLLEPSFRAAKHNIPADAELPSGLCACVRACVCVCGEKKTTLANLMSSKHTSVGSVGLWRPRRLVLDSVCRQPLVLCSVGLDCFHVSRFLIHFREA